MPETFSNLIKFTQQIDINLQNKFITLDSVFDSKKNKDLIKKDKLIPVIQPNRRNQKEPIAIARMFRWFNREIYKERYKIERTFAWQDTYRKLVLSYDRLKEIRLGFRHLAYAMVNFRVAFNQN